VVWLIYQGGIFLLLAKARLTRLANSRKDANSKELRKFLLNRTPLFNLLFKWTTNNVACIAMLLVAFAFLDIATFVGQVVILLITIANSVVDFKWAWTFYSKSLSSTKAL